jgi:hypothetical protein
MARVWFVRRRGGQWAAPGGQPAFDLPFADLIFPLDVGTHRYVDDDRPVPAPDLPRQDPETLQKVFIEVEPKDLTDLEYAGYRPGFYDSPYSPREGVRRLAARRSGAARPAG